MEIRLLVDPLTKGAFFDAYLDVACAEFRAHFPDVEAVTSRVGMLDFLSVDLDEASLPQATRLSFVQGVFAVEPGGGLTPLDVRPDFHLPDALVFGSKYRGKTNEVVTQLALNLAIQRCQSRRPPQTLLDPMAGHGTTLLWGLRYGLKGRGVEQAPEALDAFHAHIKKQTKLHRLKHSHNKGSVSKKQKDGTGKFVHFAFEQGDVRLIAGDSRETPALLNQQRFDLIVGDMPYGVQFKVGGGRKTGGRRDVLSLIRGCAEAWVESLRGGGAMVLIHNIYPTPREELAAIFSALGCVVDDFSAPHRMSESIVRDLLVLTRPPEEKPHPHD